MLPSDPTADQASPDRSGPAAVDDISHPALQGSGAPKRLEDPSKPNSPRDAVTAGGTGDPHPEYLKREGSPDAQLTAPATDLSATRPMEEFRVFYQREYRSVVGLVYTVSGAGDAAEDIADEAFLEAYKRWDRIGRYDKPGAWVRRIAIQRAQRWHSRQSAETKALTRMFHTSKRWATSGKGGAITELSAEDAELWEAVRSLPRRQAQVVFLHYKARYSVAEIGQILGLAQGTVRAQLHNGRRTLAKRLGMEVDEAPLRDPDQGASP
jgi:RNA polymerase sigma-70 factor, ECF subfamily